MEERIFYERIYNFINTYNSYWGSFISSHSISIIYIELERKNRKRKNPNVHVLQYFGLYNKYHLLDYKMKKLLGIVVLGLLCCNVVNANSVEIKKMINL